MLKHTASAMWRQWCRSSKFSCANTLTQRRASWCEGWASTFHPKGWISSCVGAVGWVWDVVLCRVGCQCLIPSSVWVFEEFIDIFFSSYKYSEFLSGDVCMPFMFFSDNLHLKGLFRNCLKSCIQNAVVGQVFRHSLLGKTWEIAC